MLTLKEHVDRLFFISIKVADHSFAGLSAVTRVTARVLN